MCIVFVHLLFNCNVYFQSSPVPTGTPKKFVAEEKNRVSSAELAKLNGKIAKFCSRAAPHNNNFRLVKGMQEYHSILDRN